MPRSTIYYTEFTERQWNWRVEIIPADSTSLPTPRVYSEIEPNGFEGIEKPTAKMGDKLPIGAMAAPTLTLKFDLAWLDSDLITYLTNPVQVDAGSVSHGTYSRTYDLANVVIVYNNRGSGTTMYPYFIGSQKPSVKRKYKISKYGLKFEIDVVHLGKVAAENVLLKDVQQSMLKKADAGTITTYTTDRCIDIRGYNGTYYLTVLDHGGPYMGTYTTGLEATMFELSDLYYEILENVKEAVRQFMRLTTSDIYYERSGSPFDAIKYYEQGLNATNTKGSSVAGTDGNNLYFVGAIHYEGEDPYNYDDQVGGYLIEGSEVSMFSLGSSSKSPTAWDWFKIVSEENYMKMRVRTSYSGSSPTVKYFFNVVRDPVVLGTLDLVDIIDDPSIECGETVISEVVGTYLGIEGDDIEEHAYHVQGSFAEDDYQFKSTFHNMPTQLPEEGIYHSFGTLGRFVWNYNGFKTNKLYYKTTPPYSPAFWPGTDFVRAHEECIIFDGIDSWSITAADLSAYTTNLYGALFRISILNTLIHFMQDTSNKAKTVAYALGESFSKYGQAKLTMQTNIGVVSIGDVGQIYTLDKDLSHYRWEAAMPSGLLGELSTTAHVMEVRDDVHKGKSDVTLFVEGS